MNWRTGIAAAATALVLLTGLSDAASADSGDVDIVGLKLGMTLDEAREAIAAYNPNLKIQPPSKRFCSTGWETRPGKPSRS